MKVNMVYMVCIYNILERVANFNKNRYKIDIYNIIYKILFWNGREILQY